MEIRSEDVGGWRAGSGVRDRDWRCDGSGGYRFVARAREELLIESRYPLDVAGAEAGFIVENGQMWGGVLVYAAPDIKRHAHEKQDQVPGEV